MEVVIETLKKVILEQDVLIKLLQKGYWELLKKCSTSQRLVGDDNQTRYYTGLLSYKFFFEEAKACNHTKRLGLSFKVHMSRVNKIFHTGLTSCPGSCSSLFHGQP